MCMYFVPLGIYGHGFQWKSLNSKPASLHWMRQVPCPMLWQRAHHCAQTPCQWVCPELLSVCPMRNIGHVGLQVLKLTMSSLHFLSRATSSIMEVTREGLMVSDVDSFTAARVTTWSICAALSSIWAFSSLKSFRLWIAFTYFENEVCVLWGDESHAALKSSLLTASSKSSKSL